MAGLKFKEGLRISPDMLDRAYDYLSASRPFRAWRLPPADEVEFHVTRHADVIGTCQQVGSRWIISISEAKVGTTHLLMQTMAHEMIHVYLQRKGIRRDHGADFIRCARRVCRSHGFQIREFM